MREISPNILLKTMSVLRPIFGNKMRLGQGLPSGQGRMSIKGFWPREIWTPLKNTVRLEDLYIDKVNISSNVLIIKV